MTRYKRRKRQVTDLIESIAGLIFLAALVYGPKLLGWFDHRPWVTPLAIVPLTTGILGFGAFFITVKKIRKQEEERRRLAHENILQRPG